MLFRWRRRHERHLEEYRRRRAELPSPREQPPPRALPARAPLALPAAPTGPDAPLIPPRPLPASAAGESAAALVDRARELAASGRVSEATAPAREAVRMLNELTGEDLDRHGPALAGAIADLSQALAADDRPQDALRLARGAADQARRLAARDHTRHRPLLADILRELGNRQAAAGDDLGALTTLRESVQVFRSLSARRPERHRAGLARALDALGIRLAAAGDAAGALAAHDEAVLLLRADHGPRTPDFLAMALVHRATLLHRLGRAADAVDSATDAVLVRRAHVDTGDGPGPGDDALAADLQTLGLLLGGAGRHDEAVEALEEAVRLRARRVRATPALARRPEVPVTYALYGGALVSAGRPADAVPPLAAAYGVGTALGLPEVAEMAAATLRRAHAADAAAVRRRWHAATGEEVPSWMTAPPPRAADG